MAKAVLVTKIGSIYDDLPEERYHFPRQYLGRMEASVGDRIIYYEPGRLTVESARRAGRRAYFATACLDRIEADQARPNHFYAFVRDYLEFDRVVPFKEGTHYYESKLGNPDGTTNAGTAQNAVRHLPDREYDLILQAGFAPVLTAEPDLQNRTVAAGLSEEALVFDRPIVERLVVRPFRDAAFAMAVKTAYQDTCAITGFKIINGGGGSEVQAAHIQPVVDRGPDSVRNGIALCSTMHWMFDRGLISIDDDLSILVARSHVPDTVGRLINSNVFVVQNVSIFARIRIFSPIIDGRSLKVEGCTRIPRRSNDCVSLPAGWYVDKSNPIANFNATLVRILER